jgi:hypothetical protein
VQGLAEYEGLPAPAPLTYNYEVPKLKPGIASSEVRFVDPLQFWTLFAAAMNENPPPDDQIKGFLPNLKHLGIELGRPWDPKKVDPLILEEMKSAAEGIGPLMDGNAYLIGPNGNGWIATPYNFGNPGADYLTRAVNSVLGETANVSSEAFYILGGVDGKGEPLTGQKKYTMTIPASMPYNKVIPPGFWSVTMYNGKTKYTVENPINRYQLGSGNALKTNADGSITIYLQSTSPGADKESNWLPSPGDGGPFYLLLRNYAPTAEADAALQNPTNMKFMPPITPIGAQ